MKKYKTPEYTEMVLDNELKVVHQILKMKAKKD